MNIYNKNIYSIISIIILHIETFNIYIIIIIINIQGLKIFEQLLHIPKIF